MRIIAGTLRGRTLKGPKGAGVRPTSDKVRQSIFDILGQWLDGLVVLDLFAGTGALALEALSRGAARAVLVDNGRESVSLCRQNAQELGLEARASVVAASVSAGTLDGLRARGPFDLVFADPPYAAFTPGALVKLVDEAGLLKEGGRLVVEHDRRTAAPPVEGRLTRVDERRFGDTGVAFYTSQTRDGGPTPA